MSTVHLISLATGEPQIEGFWPFLLHHPVAILGTLLMFGGIILGNLAAGAITDAAETKMSDERQMFSGINVIDPPSPGAQRVEALRKYEETYPHGPLIKRVRVGQFLTVLGAFIMLIGMFV
jgi:hypothetical protein